MKLKVWWIPQVPGKPFEVFLDSLKTAKILLDCLAKYDDFQYKHNIKPDYCNAGGLMMLGEEGEWTDFYVDDLGPNIGLDFEGQDIDSLTIAQCVNLDDLFSGDKAQAETGAGDIR